MRKIVIPSNIGTLSGLLALAFVIAVLLGCFKSAVIPYFAMPIEFTFRVSMAIGVWLVFLSDYVELPNRTKGCLISRSLSIIYFIAFWPVIAYANKKHS